MFTTCQLVFDVNDVSDVSDVTNVIEIVRTVYKLWVGNPLLFVHHTRELLYKAWYHFILPSFTATSPLPIWHPPTIVVANHSCCGEWWIQSTVHKCLPQTWVLFREWMLKHVHVKCITRGNSFTRHDTTFSCPLSLPPPPSLFLFLLFLLLFLLLCLLPLLCLSPLLLQGDASFWWNLKKSGEGDYLTRHAGCPVLVGSKWGEGAEGR